MDPLRSTTRASPAGQDPKIRLIDGKRLSRKLATGAISPSHRALLASELTSGQAAMSHFTGAQAAVVMDVAASYVATAKTLTPEQLEDVKRGRVSLSSFHHNKSVSDARIERFITKAGADRVLSALDKLTAPFRVAAE